MRIARLGIVINRCLKVPAQKPTLTPRELIVSRQLSSSTPLEVHSHASSEPPLTSARAGREKHAFVSRIALCTRQDCLNQSTGHHWTSSEASSSPTKGGSVALLPVRCSLIAVSSTVSITVVLFGNERKPT